MAQGHHGVAACRLSSRRPSRRSRRAAAGRRHARHAGRAMAAEQPVSDAPLGARIALGVRIALVLGGCVALALVRGGCSARARGGCASHVISIRTVPDQTPAADNAAAAASAEAFADAVAAESASSPGGEAKAAPEPIAQLSPEDAPPMYTYDPWERLNRFTYRFNSRFDEAIFLPATNAYQRTPRPIRAGIHNFFGNLAEIDSVINYTLQWRLKYGLRSLERLAINSTIGIGGAVAGPDKVKPPGSSTGF